MAYKRSRKKGVDKRVLLCCVVVLVIMVFADLLAKNKDNLEATTTTEYVDASIRSLEKVKIPEEQDEILKDYTGFTVSFNPRHRIPNYVAWDLTRDKANGQEPRKSDFHPDADVYGCPSLSDYRNSGFDRGHMAPAADMKWSPQAMYDSHALTNMCPQDNSINTGRWNSIEKLERKWALRDSVLVIVAGPVLTDVLPRSIGKNVSVPERFFKVMLAPYANPPRAIGFIVPNHPTSDGIQQMAVSVDEVEAITGYDFFAELPDEIENIIESECNFNLWQRLK